uniref:Uncharacterized protein n=1 Tax=Cacopsylla melanoneura TaxID=428564 RepID=A0A8D8VFZ5_9HEMI
MATMGSLLDLPTSDPFLERVKEIIINKFPNGWRDWPLKPVAPPIDGVDRNKLRFALPTLDIVLAYNPGSSKISEGSYETMMEKLLEWSVGKALVLAPVEFSKAFRPSLSDYEEFVENTKFMTPLILSRPAVNKRLPDTSDSDSDPVVSFGIW